MAINQVLPLGIDLSKYIGQWVVICEDKVIAHSESLRKIEEDIKKCKKTPTVTKIPKKETWIF